LSFVFDASSEHFFLISFNLQRNKKLPSEAQRSDLSMAVEGEELTLKAKP
jgi:hypothetical protein